MKELRNVKLLVISLLAFVFLACDSDKHLLLKKNNLRTDSFEGEEIQSSFSCNLNTSLFVAGNGSEQDPYQICNI